MTYPDAEPNPDFPAIEFDRIREQVGKKKAPLRRG